MPAPIRRAPGATQGAEREDGVSTVEYGLLIALIVAIVITLVFAIGLFVKNGFDDGCGGLHSHASDKTASGCS